MTPCYRTILTLGCALGLALPALSQQQVPSRVRSNQITMIIGQSMPLQMTTKKPIRMVTVENDQVVTVRPTTDPTTVMLTARAVGKTRVTLVDEDGKTEVMHLGK